MRPKKKYRFTKVILWIIAIVLFNFTVLLISLQIPYVQTELAQYLSRKLSAKTGFIISIETVDIDWADKFNLDGLKIIDDKGHDFINLASVEIDYKLASILRGNYRFDHINVNNLVLNLHQAPGDTLNITRLIHRLKSLTKQKKDKKPAAFSIDYITIENSKFSYNSGNGMVTPDRFNPNHFNLDKIAANFNNLSIEGDTIKLTVITLKTIEENTGLSVADFSTDFLISPVEMRFDSLNMEFNRSKISKSIIFKYHDYADLSSFSDSVTIQANISHSVVSSADLAYFIPYFSGLKDNYIVSGIYKGEVNDFTIKSLNLSFGKGSKMIGTVYASGLPDISETFLDIRLKNSRLVEKDMEQYVPTAGFKKYNRFDHVNLTGSFTGYIDDFVADGIFKTNLGTIVSDINLKIDDDPNKTYYKGEIKLKNFDLGAYFNLNNFGKTTLHGNIEGYGLQPTKARFSFNGAVDSLMAYRYNYSNIMTNGKFEQEYFSGILIVDDPNLQLNTTGEIDLRNKRNKIKLSGELIFANLQELKIEKEFTVIRSKIEADLQGFHIDSIQGHIFLENLYAKHREQELLIENLTFNAERNKGQRFAELISDKANIKVSGNFNYTNAYVDLKYMAKEYLLSLQNNKDSLKYFYEQYQSPVETKPYSIELVADIKNIDKVIELFMPELSLHNSTQIRMKYKHGKTSMLAFQLANDTTTFNGNTFIDNNINLDASKTNGVAEILAAADVQSREQNLNNGAKLEDLIISAIWANKKIDFNWYHTQDKISNINDIFGEIHFYKDSTHIHLKKSNLSLFDESWQIQDNNSVTILDRQIRVRNLNIYSSNQLLSISGNISNDPKHTLSVITKNIDIGLINSLLTKKLSGSLSGEFAISNLYNIPTIQSDFYISNFAINQFLVGDIFSSNDWNNDKNRFDIKFVVNRDNTPVILVEGIFDPFYSANALDLKASFMNARLDMSEPFIESLFSKLKGSITGKMHITGPVRSPMISGKGSFNNAGLKINYLNTNYGVEGTWAFDSSAIYLQNLLLKDKFENTASLDGTFAHKNFQNFRIDLAGEMRNFLVLNTTSGDNDLFYGTGIASGNLAITGPITDITIKSQATTNRGTRFFLPIGGSSSSEFEDYISFVDFSDTLSMSVDDTKETKLRGLTLDFDLDITEEAYAEIIFNITSGDIIRGRGNGHLSMNIDSQGEFTMIGSYEFLEGGYNFTMYNIVNKEFTINPRSKITWSGDPYNGIMDIDASYKLSTSLAPLVDTVYHNMPDVKRIYPTEVKLSLIGPLLTPDIEFQIIIDDYPKSNVDLDTQIKGFLNTIASDQQELNRQVFSLLIFRRFSPPNSFSSSGTIGSSVSEFVSNQLSYWISQVDENLTFDIDMDLGELDADALRTFQLRVSYAFMDGKLIITRDGGFTDPNNEASIGSIAGDWTLEYLLSEDGKLRIKIFNKTNYNQLNSSTGSDSQALITGGFSLIFTTSFDKLSDLFKKPDKNNKKNEQNLEPTSKAIKPKENQFNIPH